MAPITYTVKRRHERGAALVEFALTLPLLLVVIAGIVDFGFLFQRYEVVTNAAREGARLGALPGYTEPVVRARVRAYIKEGLGLSDAALALACPDSDAGVDMNPVTIPLTLPTGGTINLPAVKVDVNYTHNFVLLGSIMQLINANWGQSITLKATSSMRLEVPAAGS